jgi:hypothetical protein
VGSRSREKAEAFAAEWRVATAHGSYEALVSDPSLDVIYVATPHNLHHEHVLRRRRRISWRARISRRRHGSACSSCARHPTLWTSCA